MACDGTWTGCEAGGSHLPRALGRATVRAPLNAFSEMLGVGRAAPSFSRVVAAWAHGGFARAFGDRGRGWRRPAASSEPHARSSATQPPHARYEEEERPESPERPARKALRQLLGKKSRPGRGFHAEASQENAAEDTHSSWTVSGHRVAHVSTGECAISLGEAKLCVLSKTMLASSTGHSRAGRSVRHGHPGEAGGAPCCSESGLVAKTDDTTCIRHGGKDCYSCNKASCGERHAPELTRRGRRGRAGG